LEEHDRQVDGPGLRALAVAACTWLETNHEAVNALNVFPVPDGDTGTNMLLTMRSACNEMVPGELHAGKVAHALAHGALLGARGNSGVILSQILRGLARGLEQHPAFGTAQLVRALHEARNTAYRGVVRPVEGTLLTVIKDVAGAAQQANPQPADITALIALLVDASSASVLHTPDLLPVLKEAGVVDSGGFGLQVLLEGMLRHLRHEPLDVVLHTARHPLSAAAVSAALEAVEPGQEWEVVVDFRPNHPLDLQSFYKSLEQLGGSIQVGEGAANYKMHLHLPKELRLKAVEYVETMGTVVNVHMENLLDQVEQAQAAAPVEVQAGQLLAVVVAPGIGFNRLLARPGVAVISGGQSMNPSTEELLRAFDKLPVADVILLPNNKNIQMAAEQAASLSDKRVRVLPTRNMPQGIAAMLGFDPDGEFEPVLAEMQTRMAEVHTGELTNATRTVTLDGIAVREGQFIGLSDGTLACATETLPDCALQLLEKMGAAEFDLLTLYHGAAIGPAEADALRTKIADNYPQLQTEIYSGGQPHYHYILSLE
jgi:DAK2 domain fusion protein YloV